MPAATTLSPRMLEVAALVAEGLSTKAIARRLKTCDPRTGARKCLSARTVDEYIHEIAARIPGSGPPRQRIVAWYWKREVA